jgi:hypothetical protein
LGSNPTVHFVVETHSRKRVCLAIEREVEEQVASVGRFEAGGAKDHVIFGYRNDCCGFWFDPPIQPLAKRYLLVKESPSLLTNYHKILSSYLPIQIPTLDLVDRRWELDWKTGIRYLTDGSGSKEESVAFKFKVQEELRIAFLLIKVFCG